MINFRPNDRIPEFRVPAIELKHLQEYSRVSSDPNPIHLDEAVARSVGLPGVIAHGMYVAGLVASRARRWAEEQNLRTKNGWNLAAMHTRFKAMTYLGDELLITGAVRSKTEDEVVIDLHAQRLLRPDFDTDPLLKINVMNDGKSLVTVTQAQIKFKKSSI